VAGAMRPKGVKVSSLIGQRLGDYRLEAELGRGSMGVVYRATHTGQQRPYAVKVLLDALASDTSFVTRFKREANIAATLRHPNIVRVFDAGIQGAQIFFAMEYVEGVTAGRLLKQRKQLTAPQVVEVAIQASDALAYAHAEGHVVHRDIKPENLMVDRWWRTKVLDFGLARVEGLHSITSAGTVVGSLYYVSPEQLRGQKIDGRTDVYGLGVSMYEMLSGQRPHRGQTFSELSGSILSGSYAPLREVLPGVAPHLERIVARAMAREVADRYESAAEMWRDLRAFQASSTALDGAHEAARPPETSQMERTGAPQIYRRPSLRRVNLQPLSADTPDPTWPPAPDEESR
jgi:serine/threonine protein kinase